jgi:uncharacterized membrane protein
MNDAAPPPARNVSVDVLRGVVMILMALDHVRDFTSAARFSPTDLTKTNVAMFFTRFVTHYCAPTFVFLAGTGAFLSLGRGRSRAALSRFLWTRGLFLVVMELTVVRFGWTFNLDYRLVWVQVIWALGVSMIVLAGLVRLPDWVTAAVGLTMIFGHDLFDGVGLHHRGILVGASARDWVVAILHVQRPPIVYPLVPWVGVMATGFVFGRVLTLEASRRRRVLTGIAAACLALFLLLRLTNAYGDPSPWNGRFDTTGVLSLLNVTKYPPSLAYLLVTLGPAIGALSLLERADGPVGRALSSFGRAPLFYYIGHLYLIHALAILVGVVTGYSAGQLCVPFFMLPEGFGVSLGVVYALWVVVIAIMYLPTRWFADLKARRKDLVVLSYL